MVGGNPEEYAKEISSPVTNASDDTSSFKFHRTPVVLVGENRSTDVDNGACGAIALFLLEGGSEASRAIPS